MTKKCEEPKGWPKQLPYLPKPLYSKLFSQADICKLHDKPSNAESISCPNGPSANVNIRTILSSDHPAVGQFGLFASKDLMPGTFILFYVGFVHGDQDTYPDSDYDLSLDRDLGVGIDAAKMGNEARFINDYRGVNSTGPNAEFKEVWLTVGNGNYERRMAVFVLPAGKSGKRSSGVKKGAEVLVSYGKGFWKGRDTSDGDADETMYARHD